MQKCLIGKYGRTGISSSCNNEEIVEYQYFNDLVKCYLDLYNSNEIPLLKINLKGIKACLKGSLGKVTAMFP